MKAFHGKEETKAHRAARESVSRAVEMFEACGFEVHGRGDISANGPDLTVTKNGKAFRVEVKLAFATRGAWRVNPVKPARQKDDWIVIVLPDGIEVQAMSDHLRCCGKSGNRCLTGMQEIRKVFSE